MIVRELKKEDRYPAGIISLIAFHSRCDNIEEKRANWEEHPEDEDWGAFTDEGEIMARIINNHLVTRLYGKEIETGGIGAVSTLPEYRDSGAVRAIFSKLLPKAYERGEVMSALYPFNHAFYRKFGYETVSIYNRFDLTTKLLKGFSHHGFARMWRPGDDIGEYLRIYADFAAHYNLSVVRNEEAMKGQQIHGEFYKDRRFAYLLGDDEGAKAYVIFRDEPGEKNEEPKLNVTEAAWSVKEGFRMILGFLARFTADYDRLSIVLPTDVDLSLYVQDPYGVSPDSGSGYMVRAVNVKKLLSIIEKSAETSFVIRIFGDGQIPENNGTWEVTGETVKKTDAAPDLEVSLHAFDQLIAGAIDLSSAEYRPDVKVNGNRDVLRSVFIKRPIYVGDHF